MTYDVESATALLERTPAVLRAMLQDLPDAWLDAPEREGAWSPREVVHHVADLEKDAWMARLRIILDEGTARAIPSVARENFRERYAGAPLGDVLDDFQRTREANLRDLAALALDAEAVATAGVHAALGPVQASELLAAWVVHDLTHLAQINRALAAQYRDAVGPFGAFMSVLRAPSSAEPT